MAGFARNAIVAALGAAALGTPAQAQAQNASMAQDLSNCAGAVAPVGNLEDRKSVV